MIFSGLGTLASTLLGGVPRTLCRELARRGGETLAVAALTEPVVRALDAAHHDGRLTSLDDGRMGLDASSVDAVCLSGLDLSSLGAALAESVRVAKDGGVVFFAAPRRLPRATVAALFLHAGLSEIEQREMVTSGRVRR